MFKYTYMLIALLGYTLYTLLSNFAIFVGL